MRPDVVVVLHRGAREMKRRRDHRLEPRHPVHLRREQAAGIDHDQHLLAPLVFVLPRDRLAAAGRRLPVDHAGLVPRHPLAQALEQPPFAGSPDSAEPRLPPPRDLERKRAERRVGHRRDTPLPSRAAGPSPAATLVRARPRTRMASSRRPRPRAGAAPAPAARRGRRAGGTSSRRVGVSAPPSGSGSRSRTSRVSAAPGADAATDSAPPRRARRRRRPAPRDVTPSERGRGAPASRAGARPPRGDPAPEAGRRRRAQQRKGRDHREQRGADQPAAGRNGDHRGASTFSMIAAERGVGGDALQLELGRDGHPVAEHRGCQLLHVVGNDVWPSVEQGGGLRHLEQGDAAARRRARA